MQIMAKSIIQNSILYYSVFELETMRVSLRVDASEFVAVLS